MSALRPEQRNYYYLLEAERVGIHKSILAALFTAHGSPQLSSGDLGLGLYAGGMVSAENLDSFPEQVQYGANVIRALTDHLIDQGWSGEQLWSQSENGYSSKFLKQVAQGYEPKDNERLPRLGPCDGTLLAAAYRVDRDDDRPKDDNFTDWALLDQGLLQLVERMPAHYQGLPHQREAMLEMVRIWRKLDDHEQVIQGFKEPQDPSQWELELKGLVLRVPRYYQGYPHQREALLRLTQLWRQLASRSAAIASITDDASPAIADKIYDPALMAFVERVPEYYRGRGNQRQAVMEGFRLWRQLESRTIALQRMGVNVVLMDKTQDPQILEEIALQIDRELLGFLRRIPSAYNEEPHQRAALMRMVQLWRSLPTEAQTRDSLAADLKRLSEPQNITPPKPLVVVPSRPARWTPQNLQLGATIIPNGNFTWAEATHGGTRMPPNQSTVDAIVRIAKLAQQARDRINQPFLITSWYRPAAINQAVGGVSNSRHIVGDAIDFLCSNLTGNQLYWSLEPWWPGGLGRYRRFPNLCHIDARNYRARWFN